MTLLGNFNPVPVLIVGHVLRVTVSQAALCCLAALQQAGVLVIPVRLRVIGQRAGRERVFQLVAAATVITCNPNVIGTRAHTDGTIDSRIIVIANEIAIITDGIIPVTKYVAVTELQGFGSGSNDIDMPLLGNFNPVPVLVVGHVLRVTVAQASLVRPVLQQAVLLVLPVRLRVIGQRAGRKLIVERVTTAAVIAFNLDVIGAPAHIDGIIGSRIIGIASKTTIITKCIIPVTIYVAATERQGFGTNNGNIDMALLGNLNPVPVNVIGHVFRVTVSQATLYRPATLQQAGLLVILIGLRVIGQGAGRERIFQLESATTAITCNPDIIGAPARVNDIRGFMITAIAFETSIITDLIIPVTIYIAAT